MATGADVLSMLRPQGGWAISGDDFATAQFLACDPVSKKEFDEGFVKFDAWKLEQETAKELKRQALLDRLGITEEEAKLLAANL